MRIIYGVSGEGLGHVFEAMEIAAALEREGHAVKFMTFGDRAMNILQGHRPIRIEGIALYFGRSGLSFGATLYKNLKCIPFYFRNSSKIRREIDAFRPDAFVTAYEPFTTYVAHRTKKPLVSMDNQNELLYADLPAGSPAFQVWTVRLATRICTYKADHYIVKSLSPERVGTTIKNRAGKRVEFVAPLVQRALQKLEPTAGDHILVYLTKPNPRLIEIIKSMPGLFIVYCGGMTGMDGNIVYRSPGPSYLEDLRACKAIIGTTGFSLINDGLYLKKPYFGVPLKKQFEQGYNAALLRELGLGDFSEDPTRADIERFIDRLPFYREQIKRLPLDPSAQENALLAALKGLCL